MSEYKLVPVDATPEMVEAALKVDMENEDVEGFIHNTWHALVAAAPSQEVEPVACTNRYGCPCPKHYQPVAPSAELAAADMKRRCVEVLRENKAHYLDNSKSLSQIPFEADEARCRELAALFLDESIRAIEALPISDMGREKP
jgi:hypothetical protein